MPDAKPKELILKFEHLNPRVQEKIRTCSTIQELLMKDFNAYGINDARKVRAYAEGGVMLSAASIPFTVAQKKSPTIEFLVGGASLGARAITVSSIQKLHNSLLNSIKTFGILKTGFERDYQGKYKVDFSSLAGVEKTHPVFYVKGNGDLVFLPNSRMEYARFKFQQTRLGKLGLNLWRWRAYIKPPEAPQTVKNWAKAQMQKWARQVRVGIKGLKPKPAFSRSRLRGGMAKPKPVLRRRFA